MPIATPQRQGQTRPKPGAQSHGSSLSSATPASHATKDSKMAELPNSRSASCPLDQRDVQAPEATMIGRAPWVLLAGLILAVRPSGTQVRIKQLWVGQSVLDTL